MLLLSPSSHATHDEQDRGTLSPRRTGESPFLLPPLPPGLASRSQFLVSMCTLHSVATKIQYRAGEEKGRLLVWETAMIARCSMGAHFLRSASPIWQMSADRPSE